jgi:hypothetical protein
MLQPKSQYQDLTFKTNKEFLIWLEKTTQYKVFFEDDYQDFSVWYLDEKGEVLHSAPCQASVWNGNIVVLKSLKEGDRLKFYSKWGGVDTLIHRIKRVEKITSKGLKNEN